ncbi:MAG: hypothetical protein BGP06_09955 [Rhizobiales bacterium 65-9]|nr:hypothetical protein [Hyphomicrobiales bacterium]OJY33217.1 MAG: hypothetical protein BGP06_09955 [Rhizobiales bacterium 65-9]
MSLARLSSAALVAAVLGAFWVGAAPAADSERTFLLPEHDGYGLGDCLADGPGSACGRMVADAWCASKGFAKARTFGRSDSTEITGSVGRPAAQPVVQSSPTVTVDCDG